MALMLVLALALAGSRQHRTVVVKPPGTPSWLVRDAFEFAAWLHDPRPRTIRIALERNDVITMRGRFVCTGCHGVRTAKTKPPAGTFVRWLIDPRTHIGLGFSLHR